MNRFIVPGAALALIAALAGPAPLEAQSTAWSITPQVGVTFHGDYYDDRIITDFSGEDDVLVDFLDVDPGASFRVGGRVGYDFVPGVQFHGGIFASWPDADIRIDPAGQGPAGRMERDDIDLRILEFNGGATIELGEVTGSRLPVFVGGDLGLVNHSFDDFLWKDLEFIDPSTTSLTLGLRGGIDYPVTSHISVRGEIRQTFVRGAFGDFEEDIENVESRAAGAPAGTDFEGNTFSLFGLDAGLSIRF